MGLFKSLFGGGKAITNISVAEAQAQITGAQPPFVIDVRQPDEFARGHIAQATLIPLGDLMKRQAELPKDRPILCVCQSGMRSGSAARQLADAGFTVMNMDGGMSAWVGARLPVKRGA